MVGRGLIGALAVFSMVAAGLTMAAGSRDSAAAQGPLVWTPPEYRIKLEANAFTAPVGVAAGEQGALFVAESGGQAGAPPRVVKLSPRGVRSVVADDFLAPLTGITRGAGGKLYVAYRGGVDLLDPETGLHHPVLGNLPAAGDHPNGPVVLGPDGLLYLGVGSATNSGVVGEDNIRSGWVKPSPQFHDIPCRAITVRGSNFSIPNLLTADARDVATTGAFSPFGKPTARLQEMAGAMPCTGAVLRAKPDGTGLELVAWGLRSPAHLAFGPDGQLYATEQGMEDRGSRPIREDHDYLYRIEPGAWYGWPDYAGGRPVTAAEFQKATFPISTLLASPPGQPPSPVAAFSPGSGTAGLLFPPEAFGLRGEALAALAGNTAPRGASAAIPGRMVVRINPRTGGVLPFAYSPDQAAGTTLRHPVALSADADGSVLIADLGDLRPAAAGAEPVPGTGRLWRIVRVRKSGPADRAARVHWQWALVGMVLSAAGVKLVGRRPD